MCVGRCKDGIGWKVESPRDKEELLEEARLHTRR
jgi:hypothetical protein